MLIISKCSQDWYLSMEELVNFFPLLPDMGGKIFLKQRQYRRRVVDIFLMLVMVVGVMLMMVLLVGERQLEPRRN